MSKRISIVGAGPVGLLLARELAMAGMEVTVFEALPEVEYLKLHNWSDALELCILHDVGLPVPTMQGDHFVGEGVKQGKAREGLYEPHRISQLAVFAPDYSTKTVTDADFRHVLVDRQALRKVQIQQARVAGVEIRYGCVVTGLLGNLKGELADVEVKGIRVEDGSGSADITADLVVDATGQYARLRTMLGPAVIGRPFPEHEYGFVYRTVRKFQKTRGNLGGDSLAGPPFCDHYRLRSSKGYAFLHFHDDDIVDIGGGAPYPIPATAAKDIVMETVRALPQIGEELRGGQGKNLKCMPPDTMVAGGFLVVGHAAAQINPTQGCGIGSGYAGALVAAQTIKAATMFDLSSLWAYNHRWFTGQGAHYAALLIRLKGLRSFNEDDVCFLMNKNILNGEMLTNDYNGYYMPFSTNELRRIQDAFTYRPSLLVAWKKADETSRRCFQHFQTYPENWDATTFANWIGTKSTL